MEKTTQVTEYKLELGNREYGNAYGVGRYVNGCRHGWALPLQSSRERAENFVRSANLAASMMEVR